MLTVSAWDKRYADEGKNTLSITSQYQDVVGVCLHAQ